MRALVARAIFVCHVGRLLCVCFTGLRRQRMGEIVCKCACVRVCLQRAHDCRAFCGQDLKRKLKCMTGPRRKKNLCVSSEEEPYICVWGFSFRLFPGSCLGVWGWGIWRRLTLWSSYCFTSCWSLASTRLARSANRRCLRCSRTNSS